MPTPVPPAGKRAALKAQTRQAIVAAASALMDETSGTDFSVDALAERAGVSRRTVFNHFESLQDVVAAVGADVFGAVHDALVDAPPPAPPGPGHATDAVAADLHAALRRADLVGPVAALTRGLGLGSATAGPADVPAQQAMLLLRSLADVSEDIGAALLLRHPGVDPLDVELVVARTMSGLVVLHRHWFARTGAAVDDESLALWSTLLDRLGRSPGASSHVPEGHHG
ncbi:TetR/AcrR family transcriptional regulator [Isoptericola sp. NPDC057191]|uniref:TetR/AcrR family transcriptional regulator n=1 Tax=Isoptericola sp. NPDC057191 TaxID=3346041 RepID=UPI00363DB688